MTKQVVDLSEIIEQQKLNLFILRLILVSTLATFFDGYDMQGIAYVAPYLQTAFNLDKLMLGDIFSIGILGTLFGGVLVGAAGDHFGRRPAIIGSCLAFSVLTSLLAYSQSYGQFMFVRFLAGVALGGLMPAAWALNIEYAPKRFRATVVTLIMLGYTAGAALAGPIAVWLIPQFSWPSAFLFGGVGSLLSAELTICATPAPTFAPADAEVPVA
jgi:AAHS family 4-hydroxybenzoate transporter-like MFS transporter